MGPVVAGDLISLGLRSGQGKKAAWGQPLPWEPWGLSGPHWRSRQGFAWGKSLQGIVYLVQERMTSLLFSS